MFGKKRITGLDLTILSMLPTVLEQAQKTLECGVDFSLVSNVTLATAKQPSWIGEEIVAVRAEVNLTYVYEKPAIVIEGAFTRKTSPQIGTWSALKGWRIRYGGKLIQVDVP